MENFHNFLMYLSNAMRSRGDDYRWSNDEVLVLIYDALARSYWKNWRNL